MKREKPTPPSVLGFYREVRGPIKINCRVLKDGTALYVLIPSHLRNRLEMVVGNRMEGLVDRIESVCGKTRSIDAEVSLNVEGYWNELHLPNEIVQKFGVLEGDKIHMAIHRIIRYDQTINV
jgi:hypothetical protein